MFAKQMKCFVTIAVIVSYVFFLGGSGIYAQTPDVRLIVNPNKTDVEVGSDPVALTAKATGSGLQFTWTLQGPGRIEGTGAAIFYHVPEMIEGKSAQAMVTVVVKDESGQETTETHSFNILAPEDAMAEKAAAAPEPEKTGMSRNTKIAIGAGAAAAAAGAAILAFGGDDDDDDEKNFSGTFKGEAGSDVTDRGNTYTWTYTLNLQQSGNAITGTIVKESTLVGCCTNVITVPVTGTVDADNKNGANLTWGNGEGNCQCTEWIWTSTIAANSGHVTLVNGNIIRFDAGAEYVRTKVIQAGENEDYEPLSGIQGTFTRQ